MAGLTPVIVGAVVGGVLTCANAWAIWTISDIKSDIREVRGGLITASATLTGQMTTLSQDLGKKIDTVTFSSIGAQSAAANASDLSKAILETRAIVGIIESETAINTTEIESNTKQIESNTKEIESLREDVGNVTQSVSFMRGQLSQAPWIKK